VNKVVHRKIIPSIAIWRVLLHFLIFTAFFPECDLSPWENIAPNRNGMVPRTGPKAPVRVFRQFTLRFFKKEITGGTEYDKDHF
jgi:hypothetical protein